MNLIKSTTYSQLRSWLLTLVVVLMLGTNATYGSVDTPLRIFFMLAMLSFGVVLVGFIARSNLKPTHAVDSE